MTFADLPFWAKACLMACVGLVLLALWLSYEETYGRHGSPRKNKEV